MLTKQGRIVFVIGGSRSGKSFFALREALNIHGKKAFVATAQAFDEEMKERIEKHRLDRGDEWVTFEEPLDIAKVLRDMKGEYEVVVIDCLTLWLSNLMHKSLTIESEIECLISSLVTRHSSFFIVSNEVGMGIVPENELARKFRDLAGMLNQKVAEISDNVYLVTAGIHLKLK